MPKYSPYAVKHSTWESFRGVVRSPAVLPLPSNMASDSQNAVSTRLGQIETRSGSRKQFTEFMTEGGVTGAASQDGGRILGIGTEVWCEHELVTIGLPLA